MPTTFRAAYDLLLELTALLDDAGARTLAGSDACGAAWLVPGASLHRELDELARAGRNYSRPDLETIEDRVTDARSAA